MSDKIEDNPSFRELADQLKGANHVKSLLSIIAPFSKKSIK